MVEIIGVEVIDRVFLRTRSHIDVHISVVENREDSRSDVRHQMPADFSTGVSHPVRKLLRFGKEQQPHIVINKGCENDDLRLDRVRRTIWTVVRHAGHPPAVITVDVRAHGARKQFEIAGRIRFGKFRHKDAGFRAGMAAERLAETAIGATRSPLIRL